MNQSYLQGGLIQIATLNSSLLFQTLKEAIQQTAGDEYDTTKKWLPAPFHVKQT